MSQDKPVLSDRDILILRDRLKRAAMQSGSDIYDAEIDGLCDLALSALPPHNDHEPPQVSASESTTIDREPASGSPDLVGRLEDYAFRVQESVGDPDIPHPGAVLLKEAAQRLRALEADNRHMMEVAKDCLAAEIRCPFCNEPPDYRGDIQSFQIECTCCGKAAIQWPPAIQHAELPGIIVCHGCRDAAMSQQEPRK